LLFLACGHLATAQVKESDRPLTEPVHMEGWNNPPRTEAERRQHEEQGLIKRLQDTIKLLDSVDEAVIKIDHISETERAVEVFITTVPDNPLTDDQRKGITNVIKDSIGNGLDITVNIRETD